MTRKLFLLTFIFAALGASLPGIARAQDDGAETDKIELVKVSTDHGDILIYLFEDTPKHRENMLKLTKEGFYDGTTFHRIIPQFMIQGGDINSKDDDPNNDGQGSVGYTIPAEIPGTHFHKRGAVAAARLGDGQNPKRESSGSQFYIVQGAKVSGNQYDMARYNAYRTEYANTVEGAWFVELMRENPNLQQSDPDSFKVVTTRYFNEMNAAFNKIKASEEYKRRKKIYAEEGGAPHLDDQYTVFGEVVAGMDVVDEIAQVKTSGPNRPEEPIEMKAEVVEMTAEELESEYGFVPPVSPEDEEENEE